MIKKIKSSLFYILKQNLDYYKSYIANLIDPQSLQKHLYFLYEALI